MEIENKTRVFKEYTPGTYTSSDGWTVKLEKTEDSTLDMLVVRDDQGKKVDESYFFENLESAHISERFSYLERTGRRGDTELDLKFCPNHFPEGTLVKVRHVSAYRDYKNRDAPLLDTFRVKRVIQNGPRSYVLEMHDRKPDGTGPFANEPHAFNIDHIIQIVEPGKGKLDIEYKVTRDPAAGTYPQWVTEWREESNELLRAWWCLSGRLKKNEVVTHHLQAIVCNTLIDVGFNAENQGKWFHDARVYRVLKSAGIVRTALFLPKSAYRCARQSAGVAFGIIDLKKLRVWLKSNQHQIFHTLKWTEEEEGIIDDRLYSEQSLVEEIVIPDPANGGTVSEEDQSS
jgi:hypothetical protein